MGEKLGTSIVVEIKFQWGTDKAETLDFDEGPLPPWTVSVFLPNNMSFSLPHCCFVFREMASSLKLPGLIQLVINDPIKHLP